MDYSSYRKSFIALLQSIPSAAISEDAYCKLYFERIQEHAAYYLKIYEAMFDRFMSFQKCEWTDCRLIDYGCGNGIAGLYAKYCGCKEVLLVDTNAIFLRAAVETAVHLKLAVNVMHADYPEVNFIGYDGVIAADVIEHIYSVPAFLKKVYSDNPNIIAVFTTSSNPFNATQLKKLEQLQYLDEYVGNQEGGLMGPEHPPYRIMRASIIRDLHPEQVITEELIDKTRGLAGDDLEVAAYNYFHHKIVPSPAPGKNTCNPKTGSWTERIYSEQEWNQMMNKVGLDFNISPGFFDDTSGGIKKILKKWLNKRMVKDGVKFAPWILITTSKKQI